jgi:hypothetical protein
MTVSYAPLDNSNVSFPIIYDRLDLDASPLDFKLLIIRNKPENNETVENHRKHPLSEFIGAWKGDDIKDMLDLVYSSRSEF